MDIKALRVMVEKYSIAELEKCAEALENENVCTCCDKPDSADCMTDVLQAIEVKTHMEKDGVSSQDAIREFSRRVRSVLTK